LTVGLAIQSFSPWVFSAEFSHFCLLLSAFPLNTSLLLLFVSLFPHEGMARRSEPYHHFRHFLVSPFPTRAVFRASEFLLHFSNVFSCLSSTFPPWAPRPRNPLFLPIPQTSGSFLPLGPPLPLGYEDFFWLFFFLSSFRRNYGHPSPSCSHVSLVYQEVPFFLSFLGSPLSSPRVLQHFTGAHRPNFHFRTLSLTADLLFIEAIAQCPRGLLQVTIASAF